MTTIARGRGTGVLQKLLLSVAAIAASAGYVWYDRVRPPQAVPAEGMDVVPTGPALYRDGTYRGSAENASFGTVTVKVTVQNGYVVGVKAVKYPKSNKPSERINLDALPKLEREAIIAQSFDVHAVTGATYTSKAYAASLKTALEKAAKG